MRLVDGNQRQPALGQHFRKAAHPQPLRRNKQELQISIQIIHARLARHRPFQAGVDPRHLEAKRAEFGRLVFHQRDQRRNHQRRPAPGQRRKLIAQRLARTGRHHQQQVASGHRGAADCLLVGAKTREPKCGSKQISQVGRIGGSGRQ